MDLGELINASNARCVRGDAADVRVCDITEDSRTAVPGSLFIARRGLSHDGRGSIRFHVEVDVTGSGSWQRYLSVPVPAQVGFTHEFPKNFAAYWVRVVCDRPCRASATFEYR